MKINLRKLIREEIQKLQEGPKLRKGQQVWVRKKTDTDFIKGYVLDNGEIRTSRYGVITPDRNFEIKIDEPPVGPYSRSKTNFEKEQDRINKLYKKMPSPRYQKTKKVSGALTDLQFDKLIKSLDTSELELDHSTAYDLAQNIYSERGVKEYLLQQGISNRQDAYEYLATQIENILG